MTPEPAEAAETAVTTEVAETPETDATAETDRGTATPEIAEAAETAVTPEIVAMTHTAQAIQTTSTTEKPRTPVRRGLPREPGGEPWPPASVSVVREASPAAPASDLPRREPGFTRAADPADPGLSGAVAEPALVPAPTDAAATGARRGLPREPGGEPWPPAPVSAVGDAAPMPRGAAAASAVAARVSGVAAPGAAEADSDQSGGIGAAALARPNPLPAADSGDAPAAPRPVRGDVAPSTGGAGVGSPTRSAVATSSQSADVASAGGAASRSPLTVPRTVWPGAAARRAQSAAVARRPASPGASARRPAAPASTDGASRLGDYSPVQLLGSLAVLGVFALALAGITVLLARFVLALGPGQEFLAAYPGEYPLPESAPVGIPAWLNWSHFLNSFFLLFIIRTGWQVRNEKRPAAFWSPRKNKRRRISLTLWFHQAVDILWIANGAIFVILLFVTGQWMRIVPTSWEVFPNALSAALQYVSLDWPTENGWVNYNSLQQLSYFAITFLAAPLAILSGVRLSGVWPKDAERLNRLYPLEWARKVHFPVMLFFAAFIVVHVALVLATGALRNLNHMYAARGAVDPDAFAADPTGLLIFAASLAVMAAGIVAARPRVLVPIARLFGEVKQR